MGLGQTETGGYYTRRGCRKERHHIRHHTGPERAVPDADGTKEFSRTLAIAPLYLKLHTCIIYDSYLMYTYKLFY